MREVDARAAAGNGQRLFGRERELGVFDDLLREIGDGGKALLVRGEAGIGKSALLAEFARRATQQGVRAVDTTGVEAESGLQFAGLYTLLTPALDHIDQLPGPQREALSAAFGLTGGLAPNSFLIALAALELFTDLAGESPLLVIVEDAHWLDSASADALAFLSRRVALEPLVIVFAVREGIASRFDELGVTELYVEALPADRAGELLQAVAADLGPDLRARVLAEAAGNPLALIELPKAIPDEHRDAWPSPEPLPLTDRLQQAFSARVDELPRGTQILLLVAALSDSADIREIVAAARMVGDEISEQQLAPAAAASLIRIRGSTVVFRHPLVRSAIRQTLRGRNGGERIWLLPRLWPATLIEVSGIESKPPTARTKPWFRLLETAAERALQRGAASTAMAAFERAARLSASESARGTYLIRAAAIALELGSPSEVMRLVREAEPLDLDAVDRTRLLLVSRAVRAALDGCDEGSGPGRDGNRVRPRRRRRARCAGARATSPSVAGGATRRRRHARSSSTRRGHSSCRRRHLRCSSCSGWRIRWVRARR